VGRKVVDEVLHPGEVGVALGRDAELMDAPAFTLRATFGCPCRSAPLPVGAVVLAPLIAVRGIDELEVETFVRQRVVGKGAAEHGGKYEGGGMNCEGTMMLDE